MRELTDKEKKLCRELIDKDKQEHHQLRVGDVLYGLYGFECIYKERLGAKYPDSPFKIRLICLSAKRQDIVEELNEAISLLLMLREKDMISFVDSKSDKCFGDNTPKMYGLKEDEHSDAAMMDYFDVNTWQLLNSYYYLSNAFKDYCKDFKTIEQRRHEEEMNSMKCTNNIAIITAAIALLTLLFSLVSCMHQNTPNHSDQKASNHIYKENSTTKPIKTSKEKMADSIVSLSFKGFTLGSPLSPSLKNAQRNKEVWNISRNGDTIQGETKIMLLDSDDPLPVCFTIYTYTDYVYYIKFYSSSDRAFDNIVKLYKEKYGFFYDVNRDKYYDPKDYSPCNAYNYTWKYANQMIEIQERNYIYKIRDYMMDNKESLKFFLSLRDHSVYVIYIDLEYEKKARMANYLKNEKERPIKEKQKHIQDSINKTKKEEKRKAAIEQI